MSNQGKRILRTVLLAGAFVLASLLIRPTNGWAQACKGVNRCTQPNAACSPVNVGFGTSGKCRTMGTGSEAECDCVGNAAPTPTPRPAPTPSPTPTPTPSGGPPAGTPVLETVYIAGRVVSINSAGFLPASLIPSAPTALVLRLRAPWPTNLQVLANNRPLVQVPDGSPPPSPDDPGYYTVKAQAMPGWPDKFDPNEAGANWFFLTVQVTFPKQFRGYATPMFTLALRDISWNTSLTGNKKQAPDLNIGVPGHCPFRTACSGPPVYPAGLAPAPSTAFLSGVDSKDDSASPNMPRARLGIVAREVTLAGWLDSANMGPHDNVAGLSPGQSEDWHFGIFLDPDFIERNYPADTPPFPAKLTLPGQPERQACWAANHFSPFVNSDDYSCPCKGLPGSTDCADSLSLTSGSAPDAGAFLLAGNEGDALDVELNSWHPSRHGGTKPPGWKSDIRTGFADNAWAFDTSVGTAFPANSGLPTKATALAGGDYVIVTGTLWQDIAHGDQGSAFDLNTCVDHILHAQGGWLEIHPVDVVRYVPTPPPLRKHVAVVAACSNPMANFFKTLVPPFAPPATNGPYGLRFREIPDPRFTKHAVQQYLNTYIDPQDRNKLIASGSLNNVNAPIYYKAVEVMWWERLGPPQLTVTMAVEPPGDPGLFTLQVDGSAWSVGVGNGGNTGPRTTTAGAHKVNAVPVSGVKASDYTLVFGSGCSPDGSLTLALGDIKTCTATAVSKAPCIAGRAGFQFCSGVCVNTVLDIDNCGRCGNSCSAGLNCKESKCILQSCAPGFTACCGGDVCVRPGTKCPVCR